MYHPTYCSVDQGYSSSRYMIMQIHKSRRLRLFTFMKLPLPPRPRPLPAPLSLATGPGRVTGGGVSWLSTVQCGSVRHSKQIIIVKL